MTATPRPWKYSTNVGPTKALIVEADGSTILELSNRLRSSSFEHNVAFAVRAVNAHDDLVTALQKIADKIDRASGQPLFKAAEHDALLALIAKATA